MRNNSSGKEVLKQCVAVLGPMCSEIQSSMCCYFCLDLLRRNRVRFGALQVRYEDWMRRMGLGFVAAKSPVAMEVLRSG
ncbi:hypothetical protein Pyn_11719 [Prunus yedoensis var. nudiflora]|uniref:Uncharacterized protein n=1 Tax=Prunus yedoensis var. nudiflora TaxID=2094558 RepID=A0A314U8Y0_PRUYE|nr:hypothetical protein Pyn_11719 [Prunus yedoensis var. nudiflora]